MSIWQKRLWPIYKGLETNKLYYDQHYTVLGVITDISRVTNVGSIINSTIQVFA